MTCVWHGSGRLFNEFSLEYIGTGEGGGFAGWGIYFTETKDVARQYRNHVTSFREALFKGMSPDVLRKEGKLGASALDALITLTWDKMVDTKEERIKLICEEAERGNVPSNDAKWLLANTEDIQLKIGYLYQAEIPKSDIYLDYDKLMVEQKPEVYEIITKILKKSSKINEVYREDLSGKEFYQTVRNMVYLKNPLGPADKDTTLFLQDSGFDGIVYLDSFSRDIGNGTNNYALFSPKAIKITCIIPKEELYS